MGEVLARILVLGASGLLGQYVVQEARKRGHEVWGSYLSSPVSTEGLRPIQADLRSAASLERAFDAASPDWTVLCGALTSVDSCEEHPDEARRVNGEGPARVARFCQTRNVRLVHVSTDYVFDGKAGPYDEEAVPRPLSQYGASKREGEVRVLEMFPEALVIRLCAVYGWNRLRRKANSVTWILGGLRAGREVPLFTDQRVSPTYAHEAACAILDLAPGSVSGLLHYAAPDCVTRLELGEAVADVFDLPKELLRPSTLAEARLPAPRPPHSCLTSSRADELLNTSPRPLRDALAHMRDAE